ncbi:MAG TPA: F420-0:Gamma-glutamyl ligase [Firmicutes bacterium]|nr:F420-0:Gamma-glutamyl ligase [Bacillota bacterium]
MKKVLRLWNKENTAILRIRTHLITQKDAPADIVHHYTKGVAEPQDLVGIAESVVAIMQGRAIEPEQVIPGILARFLSRFAHPDASISAERSMQMAICEVGAPRIILAALCALAGKIFGIKGTFFRIAGHQVAEIDDSGGTMPPFERHIILGPENPNLVARQIWKKTGLWTLILDVNDKGSVDILGTSFSLKPHQEEFIKDILRSNPFGNDDQKTPLIIIKFPKEGKCPSLLNKEPND